MIVQTSRGELDRPPGGRLLRAPHEARPYALHVWGIPGLHRGVTLWPGRHASSGCLNRARRLVPSKGSQRGLPDFGGRNRRDVTGNSEFFFKFRICRSRMQVSWDSLKTTPSVLLAILAVSCGFGNTSIDRAAHHPLWSPSFGGGNLPGVWRNIQR